MAPFLEMFELDATPMCVACELCVKQSLWPYPCIEQVAALELAHELVSHNLPVESVAQFVMQYVDMDLYWRPPALERPKSTDGPSFYAFAAPHPGSCTNPARCDEQADR